MTWTDTDLAYLAGFIDGEGSICVFPSGQRDHLRLDVYNTNEGILRWIQQTFGGRVNAIGRPHDRWKREYTWTTGQQHAAQLLTACLPYLKLKRRQAELFIRHQATSKRGGNKGTPPEVLSVRAGITEELRALNRKGCFGPSGERSQEL